jgi:hypothetical protein
MSSVPTRLTPALVAAISLLAACTSTPVASSTPTSAASTAIGSPTETPFPAVLHSNEPYAPAIDPADFQAAVDNSYFPLAPGSRWVLEGEGESAGEVTTTRVTSETKTIMGVVCTVVRDEVKADGALLELTFDWYAQDRAGNVWYFGEETAEYENGTVTSTAGSWEAGVDGAQPGIIMPASPAIGVTYRQEFYAGEAEDLAKAVDLAATADTPAGSYADVLVTEDWTPLEPDVVERKFYAPGIGLVMERLIRGGSGITRLVEYSPPA